MKRTYIAAALLATAAVPAAMAADYYYVYPSGTYPAGATVVAAPVPAAPVVYYSDATTISLVQQRLLQAGYSNVSVNGVLDSRTSAALRDLQHRHDFAVTGSIDQQTLVALGLGGGSGSVGGVPVIITAPTPIVSATPIIISAPKEVESMPRNYEGSPGNNLGSLGTNRVDAQWSANY